MRIPLYGPGMHDFVLRELEVGFRVAYDEDAERAGWGPFWGWMAFLELQGHDLRFYGEDYPDFSDVDDVDRWLRS